MLLVRGIRVSLCLAFVAVAADPAPRRVLTTAVDSRTGNLIRVPVRRYRRPVATRTVAPRAFPEKVIEAREIRPEPVSKTPPAPYNIAGNQPLERLIEQVALAYRIHPGFVHAVIKAESNYNPRAVSDKGAMGLMQLMPQTARRFGVANVFSPAENLEGGVRYLRYLLDLYGDAPTALSIAAYNAGEGAVDRHGSVPPYTETRQFVRRVNALWKLYKDRFEPATPAPPPKKLEGPRIYKVVDSSGFIRYTTNAE